eukprot:13148242-Alexandrium_andersonii.AAC.1
MCNYKLVPKHHYWDHILEDLASGENPRWLHCFQDEDFMGKVTKVCGHCHRASCVGRSLQRYRLHMFRRWDQRLRAQTGRRILHF